MLDETVETRRPWRGSPCPAIRGRAFLCIVCIIQQYLGSFAIRSRESVCPSRSHVIKPLALWQNENISMKKRKIMMTKNCRYATLTSKHYISVSGTTEQFLQVHTTLKRADHFASFYKGHGSFRCFNYQSTAGKFKCRM